jgi:type IV pilus assembly protein PilC
MPVYLWEGTSAEGKKVSGNMEAANQQVLFNLLKAKKINPNVNRIREKGKGMEFEIKIPGFGPKVATKDVVIFTRQFATMIDAGLPLMQGLEILGRKHENKAMSRTLLDIKDTVESGGTLAEAMGKHPKAFDDLFVNMIAAGEAGGILDIILERMAGYLEKSSKLKGQVKTAMIYPGIVVGAATIVTSVLLIFVIPTFAEMFGSMGQTLPVPTQMVMAMSDFMVNNGFLLLIGVLGLAWMMKKFLKTERGKQVIHPLYLKMPVFGDLIRKIAVARFTRTLGTMLNSGVPILDALAICARTASNLVVETEINRVRAAISEGKPITEPLENSVIFPSMVVQMIAVGESTGALDSMLQKIADFYEDEVENAVNGMKQMIEPLMILFLGTIVGGLVIAMYLPIFKMGSAL